MLGAAGSIRRQIVLGTSLLLGLTLVITLLVVTIVQQKSTETSLKHVEKTITGDMGLNSAVKFLSQSHGLIMATLMDDNAFSDVQSLVARAVQDDPGLLYGLVVDVDGKVWAFAHPKTSRGAPGDEEESLAASIDGMGEPVGERELEMDGASLD